MSNKIPELLEFINAMDTAEQFHFAQKCGSSAAHIRNIAHGYSTCSEKLAINIERESERKVVCERLRDDCDWAFIRGTPKERRKRKS